MMGKPYTTCNYLHNFHSFMTLIRNTNQGGQKQALDAYKQNAFQIPKPYMKLDNGKGK